MRLLNSSGYTINYAVHVTSMGWTLLTRQSARIDTARLVSRPGTKMIMYRTTFMLRFKDDIPDSSKQAFFVEKRLRISGVTTSGVFYVNSRFQGHRLRHTMPSSKPCGTTHP